MLRTRSRRGLLAGTGAAHPLIAAGAAFYAGLGAASFLAPGVVPAVIGYTATNADTRTEIRAVYGGLPLAFAATLVANPTSGTTIGLATAGMAAGRVASAAFEGRPSLKMVALAAAEAAVAGALLVGARRVGMTGASPST